MLFRSVFLAEPNGNRVVLSNAHEASWFMGVPLFLLTIITVVIGFLTRDLFIGFGTHFWGQSIFVLPHNYVLSDIEFTSIFYKLLPLVASIFGVAGAYVLYTIDIDNYYIVKGIPGFRVFYTFLNKKWYFDRIYNQVVVQNVLHLGYHYAYKDIDRGLVEKIGPSGIVESTEYVSKMFTFLQTGLLFHYLFLCFFSFFSLTLLWIISSYVSTFFILATFLSLYVISEEI